MGFRQDGPPPPAAQKRPSRTWAHGVEIVDDYAWLRADNWREVLKDPAALPADIRAQLDAENAYAARLLKAAGGLRKTLIAEMRGRIKEDDEEPPFADGPFLYYSRYRTGGEHPIFCRKPRSGGAESVLLDGDAEGEGKAFFDLGDAAHAPNHRLLAWSADTQGSEYHTIRVRDLATGEDLDAVVETTGAVVWLKNSDGFLYVRLDDNHRDNRVFLHRLGAPQSEDVLLHEEAAPGFFVSISETQDRAFALIDIHDHETSEVRLVDPDDPAAAPRLVAPRVQGRRYDVEHHAGRLAIRTNADGASDYKIVTAPAEAPGPGAWRGLVPHEPGRLIAHMASFAGHLVLMTRRDAAPAIVVRAWDTGESHAIAFSEPTYALGFSAGYEHDTTQLRFTYSSLTTPQETYDYDMATRTRRLLKRRAVPSGHDPARYVTRRIDAPASDGETVPVSILHRADQALDGSAPCLLYGYGSYGIVIPVGFRTNILSLVDRGFVFAIAHVRGGRDKGQGWYEAGKRERKPNTFTDFIAAAEALIAAGFTARGRIVAQGGSAGGMLMGAAANLRPDLFAGVIAEVPFVDVLTTMLDKDLPLTPPEWPEWGNPIESKADFETIRAYSPYDNVAAQAYPAMLIEAGLSDPRVTYWEPAKWAARLRATMTGGGPILLNTNMDAGHGGASGRLKQLADDARAYAFALMAVDKA